jgi:hypothetical protein
VEKVASHISRAVFSTTLILFLLSTASVLTADAQSTRRGKPAASARWAGQEQDTENVDNWRALYLYYSRYRHCGFNADAAEGISEAIAKLLVNKSNEMTTVARELRLQQGFRRYVLGGVNGTVDENDLNMIIQKDAERRCAAELEGFCRCLTLRANQALIEIHQITDRSSGVR